MICPLDSTNSLRTDLSEGRNLSPFSAMRRLRALLRARSWAPHPRFFLKKKLLLGTHPRLENPR